MHRLARSIRQHLILRDFFISRYLNCLSISWLLLVQVALSGSPCDAAFVVSGKGVAGNSSDSWVAGETIDISFSYDTSSFGNDVFTSSPSFGIYQAITPIPLTVVGSTSGTISAVGPIGRVTAVNNGSTGDVARFENADVSLTQFGTAFSKQDTNGLALSIDPPQSFSALQAAMFPALANENPWTSSPTALFLGTTNTNLQLLTFQWTVAELSSADFDGDGDVDGADLAVWQSSFGIGAGADADGDGDSDGADFIVWQLHLGSGLPLTGQGQAVPEPAGLGLMLFGFVCYSMVCRKDQKKDLRFVGSQNVICR